MRPADQDLSGADGPDALQRDQFGGDGANERGEFQLEFLCFRTQGFDSLTGTSQGTNGHTVFAVLGRPVPELRAGIDQVLALHAAEFAGRRG